MDPPGTRRWFDSHCHAQERYEADPAVLARARRGRRVAAVVLHRHRPRVLAPRRSTWPRRRRRAARRVFATVGLHPHEAAQGSTETAALLERSPRRRQPAGRGRRVRARLLLRALTPCCPARRLRGADRARAPTRPRTRRPRARRVGRPLRHPGERRACPSAPCCTASPAAPPRPGAASTPACTSRSAASSPSRTRRRCATPRSLCPLERLLVETDSPFLAPVPHRGERNEPGYVPSWWASSWRDSRASPSTSSPTRPRDGQPGLRRRPRLTGQNPHLTWSNAPFAGVDRAIPTIPSSRDRSPGRSGCDVPEEGRRSEGTQHRGEAPARRLVAEPRDPWGASPATGHWGAAHERRSRGRRRWSGRCGRLAARPERRHPRAEARLPAAHRRRRRARRRHDGDGAAGTDDDPRRPRRPPTTTTAAAEHRHRGCDVVLGGAGRHLRQPVVAQGGHPHGDRRRDRRHDHLPRGRPGGRQPRPGRRPLAVRLRGARRRSAKGWSRSPSPGEPVALGRPAAAGRARHPPEQGPRPELRRRSQHRAADRPAGRGGRRRHRRRGRRGLGLAHPRPRSRPGRTSSRVEIDARLAAVLAGVVPGRDVEVVVGRRARGRLRAVARRAGRGRPRSWPTCPTTSPPRSSSGSSRRRPAIASAVRDGPARGGGALGGRARATPPTGPSRSRSPTGRRPAWPAGCRRPSSSPGPRWSRCWSRSCAGQRRRSTRRSSTTGASRRWCGPASRTAARCSAAAWPALVEPGGLRGGRRGARPPGPRSSTSWPGASWPGCGR